MRKNEIKYKLQLHKTCDIYLGEIHFHRNSYFLHWIFDEKSCFVVFFHEWKNPQLNFSSQNLSIERNFFKWDGKVTKIRHLLFHRIWKNYLLWSYVVSRRWKIIYITVSTPHHHYINIVSHGLGRTCNLCFLWALSHIWHFSQNRNSVPFAYIIYYLGWWYSF